MNKDIKEIKYQYKHTTGILYEKIEQTKEIPSKHSNDLPTETKTAYWSNTKQAKWVRQADKLTCDLIVYNYAEASEAESVIVLSDEEDVEFLNQYLNFTQKFKPTCLPDNEWHDDYEIQLKDKHIVIMLRKNDNYANFFATRLVDVAMSIRIVTLNYKNMDSPSLKNPGVKEWLYSIGSGSLQMLLNIIDDTLPIDKESKEMLLAPHISLSRILQSPKDFEKAYVLERISQLHSKTIQKKIITRIAGEINLTPEEAEAQLEAIREKVDSEEKIQKQEEASEVRLKGLIDVAINEQKQRVFLVLDNENKLTSLPFIDGINEYGENVRFIPPQKIDFPMASSNAVLKYYGNEDTTLFKDLMDASKKYVHLKEIDRLIMTCTIFLSYVIHHPDIHYLPIVFMVSPPNHGKSHVLKLIAQTGYRGKWLRSFNLSACVRYNDEFHSVTCLDLYNFAASAKGQDYMDFILGKIEKGATIPKVNRPSAERYQQSDEYDPYGLLVIGSNSTIPRNYEALLTRIIPLNNISSDNKEGILKPDNPLDFIEFRNRLTAWKARMMKRKLPDRGYIDLDGRLFDMGQPFLQVLNASYPQGYDMMVDYLKNLEHQKKVDKSDSSEAIILSVIKFIYNEETLRIIRETGSRPKEIWISQRRMIDDSISKIPALTNRSIMNICREKFNFIEVKKLSYDYLIKVEDRYLHSLLKSYCLEEYQNEQINIPDTPAELIEQCIA